tara:strand:+ start:188 stop:1582 length:1395 start_codon:yes stop_codon:yes gene_type:complete
MEVLQRTANRGSISTGYEIPGSIKFEEDNLEGMYAQPTAAGNRRTWTASLWFKRTELTTSGHYHSLIVSKVGSETGSVYITPTDEIICDVGYGGTRNRQQTQMKFRDPSAWYHIVWRVDTTQSTAADRHRLYVNGVLQEWTTIDGYPDQNFESYWNNNIPIYVGIYGTYNNYGACAYIAEIHHTDGISNAPTEFGEFDEDSGIWKPIKYEGNYGAQGFYLPFDDVSAIGKNGHGNDVNFTLQNISAADYSTDTPTNNFCTWSSLWNYASYPTISEGGTKVRIADSTNEGAKATIGLTNGKWYWEAKPFYTLGAQQIGIQTDGDSNIYANANSTANNYTMWINPIGYYYTYADGQTESADQGWDLTADDWLGIALDMDSSTQTIKYYKNGSLIQSRDLISEMQGRTVFPFLMNYENRSWDINFGGYTINTISSAASDGNGYGTFEYAPPSGYYAICTKNLAEYGG